MAKKKRNLFDINSFDVVTRNNFKKMYDISTTHYNKLLVKTGIAAFDALIAALLVVLTPYTELYTIWFVAQGSQTAKTSTLDDLLAELSPVKITSWEAQIIVKYAVNSERFNELLPHGHAPFGKGSKEERILAVKNLVAAIGSDVQLSDLKNEIDNFYTLLKAAREGQQGKFQTIEETSSQLEVLRIALAAEMYANKGLLMSMFKTDPSQISSFFDVAAMRNGLQTIFVGNLKHDEFKKFIKRTFKPGQMLRITTTQNVRWFLSKTATTFDGSMQETLANISRDISVDDFMVILKENKNLIGLNLSGTEDAEVRIEVL